MFLPRVGSSGSESRERTGSKPGSEFEFGERIWPNSGSAGSEFGEFMLRALGLILSVFVLDLLGSAVAQW